MGLHLHEMRDTDKHFIIDPVTRAITNANAAKNKLIQFDHNSEIFTFEIPQYVDGHDMNKCDKVEIHYINIDGKTKEQSKDLFNAKAAAKTDSDLVFNLEGEKLIFCWKISGNATKYAGSLNFLVCFSCIDDAGAITYKWHTDIFKGIIISDGLSNTEAVAEQYSDVLEQWKKELENASGSGSGSGGSYVVNIIDNGDDTFRTDKTFSQISEAIAAGKEAVCVFGTYHYQLVSCTDTKIVFSVSECEGVVSYKTITIDNTNGDGEVIYNFDMPGYQYETDGNLQTEDITVVGAINEVNAKVNGVINNGTLISENADFAEVGEWSDGNPDAEDRTGYFVSVDTSEPGETMVKATSTSDVRGVTMLHPAFAGNASADKYDADGNLLSQYAYVGFAGFVPVIDNGTCTVNGRCMPADDGTAVPSTNNMGYQVIERIDDTHVLVLVEPQADMMVRIKADVSQLSEEINKFNGKGSSTLLNVSTVFDCTNIGADATADTELINQILTYAKEKSYNYILFPKASKWLLMPSSNTENTILIPTKTIVDLNGSTLQVSQNNVMPIYRLIGFEEGAEYSKLCNGTFVGDRDNTNIGEDHSGNTECLWLSGNSNIIERMTIKDSLGDGIIIDGSIIITQAKINGSSYFVNNSYVTGEAVANTKVLSTSELLTLSDYYKGIGDFLVDFHYTSVSGTAIHPSFSNTTLYFYDSDGLLIDTLTTRTNRALEKTKIPKNAISFRIEVSLDVEITSFTGNWYLLEIYGANNCGVVDCIIDNNRRNGVTIAQSNGCFIDNSIICNTNGFLPKRGIDFEPEWGIATDFTLSKTTFYGNETGATACVGAYGLEVKECHFMEAGQFTGSRNLHVDKCTFETGYTFSDTTQHYAKNYCMHQAIIENCIFRCKSKSNIKGGSIFKNNSFYYGINGIESHSAKLIDNVFYNSNISIYVEEVIRNKFYGKQVINIGCGKFIGNYIESTTSTINLCLNKFTPIGNTFVFKDNYLNVATQPCIRFAIAPNAKRYVFDNNIFMFGELTKVTNFISKYNSVVIPEDLSFMWVNNYFDLPTTIDYDVTSGTLGVTNKDNVYVGYNQNLTVNVTESEATE